MRLSGTAWEETFKTILAQVAKGLGCQNANISAELYKLLLYDAGGFFVSHRDTEKTEGMFGTLVIVLPSLHSGGEIVVRHAGREVRAGFGNNGRIATELRSILCRLRARSPTGRGWQPAVSDLQFAPTV
jgi:hypothetical protein